MSYGLTILKNLHPIASKEHKCMFCGRMIKKGEKYHRQSIADGYAYDFVECEKCEFIANELDMYYDCQDVGLDEDAFLVNINEYVKDNHYDDSIDDIAKDWKLPFIETVDKVYEELINKNK